MSPFGLKFSQMILHTETSKLMYNWSFLCYILHKQTLLPSTFNKEYYIESYSIYKYDSLFIAWCFGFWYSIALMKW